MKTKFIKRGMSGLMAVLMAVTAFVGLGTTTAFAASETAESYMVSYNDLASTEPELMKEWDYSKNKIDPTKILRTAYNRAWWKCEFGHSWNAPICDRTLGDCSCKECESEFIASLPQLLTM